MRTSLAPIVAATAVLALLPVILCQYQTPDQYGQYGSRYPGYGQGQYGSQYGSQYQTGQQFPTSYQSGGYVPRGSGYNPSDPYNTNCKS